MQRTLFQSHVCMHSFDALPSFWRLYERIMMMMTRCKTALRSQDINYFPPNLHQLARSDEDACNSLRLCWNLG